MTSVGVVDTINWLMTIANTIRVSLSGRGARLANLSDFACICKALQSSLEQVARCTGAGNVEFSVSNLAIASADIEVMPIANGTPESALHDIAETFRDTIQSLEKGEPPDTRLDFLALRTFREFARPLRRKDVRIEVCETQITRKYKQYLSWGVYIYAFPADSKRRGSLQFRRCRFAACATGRRQKGNGLRKITLRTSENLSNSCRCTPI